MEKQANPQPNLKSDHSNPILAQYDLQRKAGVKSKKYLDKHKLDAAEDKLASKNPADSDSDSAAGDNDISKPKKALHRQRAHINPMNDTPYPL